MMWQPPLGKDVEGRSLVTRTSLRAGLQAMGLAAGDVVCAHVGMSRLGYVCGAAQTIIEALLDAVGGPERGTVMMPAFSGELSDPATWRFPPVPEDWVDVIRRETPPFDPVRTPTRLMGVVAEMFRHWPGTCRSPHPHSSFTANGAHASALTASHPLDFRFGPASPLGKLAALDGKVLLLGAGNDRASFVYLAQQLSGIGAFVDKSAPMAMPDGTSRWVPYRDVAVQNRLVLSAVDFLLSRGVGRRHPAGDGSAVVFGAREALAAVLDWQWRDAGFDLEVCRAAQPLPRDWSEWA